ncbi:MAG: D-aminoacylase [Thermodesulfovibrionales bacterium]|nr:D-aminoacylase [Thermodesulfovibrionales bacterium]
MLDYFIKNGIILDGSGSEPFEANVGILGDKITYVGRDGVPAHELIDANGCIVSPGFIDTHAHSEFTLLADGRAEGKLSQGVTTEINGNCGLSAAPLFGDFLEHREVDLKELGIKERWSTFSEYFHILKDKGIAVNFATLCGHGNIRASVIGYKHVASNEKAMLKMKSLLADAVEQGANGLSTGLIYPPGVYSNTEELIELCSSLITHHSSLIYASHMRSEGDALIEAIEEVIRIAEKARIKVHISHIKTAGEANWQKADMAIERMENARQQGLKLTCDRYPYIAASTDLDSVLPSWTYEGGVDEELKRLGDPYVKGKIKAEIGQKNNSYWQGIYISSVNKNKWMEGRSIFDIASEIKKEPLDTLFEILIEEKARAGAIFFSMSEANIRKFLSLSYTMIGSDSSARCFTGHTCTGKPHPRGFGTFPRFISKYVRDEGLITLKEAIKRMTGLPALTFGLDKRGFIKEGFYADITLFDYEKITDTATFKEPYKKAEGINYVFVNGKMALKEGEFTGSLSGMILK